MGQVLVHRNMRANPDSFLKAVAPYREDLVVAVQCMFTWYWLADLCRREKIAFVLGRRIGLEIHSYEQRRSGNEVAHHITAHMNGPTLTVVAGANTVELAVGQVEEILSDDHLREIRRLARRVGL